MAPAFTYPALARELAAPVIPRAPARNHAAVGVRGELREKVRRRCGLPQEPVDLARAAVAGEHAQGAHVKAKGDRCRYLEVLRLDHARPPPVILRPEDQGRRRKAHDRQMAESGGARRGRLAEAGGGYPAGRGDLVDALDIVIPK